MIFCCCATGCGNRQIHRNLEELYRTAIRLPDTLERIAGGEPASGPLPTAAVRLVSYYPSDACTSCTINQLAKWEPVFELAGDGRFLPVILFSPDERGYKNLLAELRFTLPPYPVYVDREHAFESLNPAVPADSRYHTFLLDRNGRVVLVGNPLAGDTMWELFRRTLDNLLTHDGIYVEEKKR